MLSHEQTVEKWKEIKGGIRNMWGKITDDELDQINGDLTQLSGLVEKKYGQTKESIKKDIEKILNSYDNDSDKSNHDTNRASYEREPEGSLYQDELQSRRLH